MKKTILIATSTLCFILLVNCGPEAGEQNYRYIIVNSTNRDIGISIYDTRDKSFVKTASTSGTGIILEANITVFGGDSASPVSAFEGDSISVNFDNEKLEGHTPGIPFGRSLLDVGDYLKDGNRRIFRITEEDYNNATPCNGPCD